MKRIPNSKDSNNVMRPGTIFTSSRDDGLRYIDKDGAEAWNTPNSRYYASQIILRGQAVSIAKLEDLTTTQATDEYPYIKVTDPDLDETCIGVAMNYAQPGDIVHVQSKGKFSYYTRGNVPAGRENKEVILDPNFWNYQKVQGQRIFVKKINENPDNFETGHDTEDPVNSVDLKNNFTYDLNDSIYNVKHTIQLGYLTDAPTSRSAGDSTVTIELDVTGDTRGPIDNTQFLMTLGEDVHIGYDLTKDIASKPLYTQDIPHFNLSIKEELKVLAMSTTDPYPASFGIAMANPVLASRLPANQFIAVRKLDGKTIFLSMFNQLDLDGVTDANDRGYISLSKGMASSSADLVNNTIISAGDITTISNAIKTALDTLTGSTSTVTVVGADGREFDEASERRVITAGVSGGYYDVYVSQGLLRYVDIYFRKHGHSAEKGTAILADIRDKERCNILGIALIGEGNHPKGEKVRIMKMGRITTKSEILVGKQYYLGLNGKLTAQEQYWYDYCVPIGIAESPHYFIVDVTAPLKNYDGAMPLGSIKPSIYGTPEKGYVVMDGYTVYNKAEYPELYEALKQWYSEDELKPSHRSPTATDFHNAQANFLGFINTTGGLQEFFASVQAFQNQVESLRLIFEAATESADATLGNLQNANDLAVDHINTINGLLGESLLTTAEFEEWKASEGGYNELKEDFDALASNYDTTKNSFTADLSDHANRLQSLENVIDPTNNTESGLRVRIENLEDELGELNDSTIPNLNESLANYEREANGRLDAAENRIGALETETTNLGTRATTLENRATALEDRASTIETDVANLEDRVSTAEVDIDNLEDRATNLENRSDTTESNVTDLQNRMGVAESKISTLEEGLSTANSEIDSLNDDLNDLSGELETTKEDVEELETNVTGLQTNLETTNNTLAELASTVDGIIDTTIPGIVDDVANVKNDYLKKDEAEATYLKKLDAEATYLEKVEAENDYLKKTDAAETYATKLELEEFRTSVQERLSELDAAYLSLKGMIDLINERLATDSNEDVQTAGLINVLYGRVEYLENEIANLKVQISNLN